MTLTLELPPEVEGALAEEAQRQGTTLERLVLDDLRQRYAEKNTVVNPTVNQVDPTLAIFAQWAAEDPVTGPEDFAARQREGDELMAALAANGRFTLEGRTDFRALFGNDEENEPQEKAE